MSYFTETFESILEFKGEAELAYAKRIQSEKQTHKHGNFTDDESYGKYMYRNGVSVVSRKSQTKDTSNPHNDAYTPKGLTNRKTGTVKQNYKNQVDYHNYVKNSVYGGKDNSAVQHSIEKHNKKVNKESFDPVYEDLCRMGIID